MTGPGRPLTDADAIVVGAGHNGLVAAAYLARAGWRVVVVERRAIVGGAAETTTLGGGFRAPAAAQTVGRLRPAVVRDLRLHDHGLSLVAPEVRVFAPSPDGSAVALWADVARTADGLRARSAADAAAYPAFDRLVRSLGRFLAEIAATTPPDIAAPTLADAMAGLRLGRSYRGLGRADSRDVLRILPMPVADFVAESFETDAVRAAIAARGIHLTTMGPRSAGTAAVLLADSAGTDGGAAGQTVFARGGPGAVGDALAASILAAGGTIRLGADVVAVTSRDERVTGVALASGEELRAPVVVAAIDPRTLLTRLVDPVALGPTLVWRAGNIRANGSVATVTLALAGLPRFTAAIDDERLIRGRIVVAPGTDDLERAFDASKYGALPAHPYLEATIPSLVDPSLVAGATLGRRKGTPHVMAVTAQWFPYDVRGADWEARREAVGDLVVAELERVAPGIGRLVVDRRVLTPVDLEREYGLPGGHPLHAEAGLDQWFMWRPMLGLARYRMPIRGLYLAGAGAHPGGGITGGPGANAAREILADGRPR